jgi:hypothetical protein|tara:strand:+ start:174 stop:368 length:195 start_codon:yes stop_codon:yes gene_type:complete
MDHSYSFNRDEEVDYTGQYTQGVQTHIRGRDLPLGPIFSGIESFTVACGFELNGSGIGLVAKPE